MECQGTLNILIMKKNKVEGLTVPDFKIAVKQE